MWAPLKETFQHSLKAILQESVNHEKNAVKLYVDLLEAVEDASIYLEEFARTWLGKKSFTRWNSRRCSATTARRPVPTSDLLISSMSLARSLFYAWENGSPSRMIRSDASWISMGRGVSPSLWLVGTHPRSLRRSPKLERCYTITPRGHSSLVRTTSRVSKNTNEL